jgi:hypothetical protein
VRVSYSRKGFRNFKLLFVSTFPVAVVERRPNALNICRQVLALERKKRKSSSTPVPRRLHVQERTFDSIIVILQRQEPRCSVSQDVSLFIPASGNSNDLMLLGLTSPIRYVSFRTVQNCTISN